MTKIINFFGGPGIGKSTISADLFCRLKCLNASVELVQEYAKEVIWDDRTNVLTDQLYITAKQNRRITRLVGKVDFVVTDSPIILGAIYAKHSDHPNTHLFEQLFLNIFNECSNINILLDRQYTFQQTGRIHDEASSIVIDETIKDWLEAHNVPYIKMSSVLDLENLCKLLQNGSL